MRRLVLCFAALLPLAMTAACGQKGALYLPPKNGTVVTRPAGVAPTPAAAPAESTAPSSTPQPTNQSPQNDKKDNTQTPPK